MSDVVRTSELARTGGRSTFSAPEVACMASLVGSLADNKAALGRRYAEWGVSAPTLESAVAAAAMAQDEMGHARSTYPVLKALGIEAGDEGLEGRGNRLALLDDELPDWMAFIAANLLVDGILTTFVAATVDSAVSQMAQRAKKILQEEGSHRVHAEAWAKRLCRAGGGQRRLLLEHIARTWEHAGRWGGPAGDPGFAAAVRAGFVSKDGAEQREQVRSWLVGLLAGEGVEISLPEPTDWSGWDPERRRWTP
jgi:ring-1,2-phenylacetyl-CoA epoxidase subunit PaaC